MQHSPDCPLQDRVPSPRMNTAAQVAVLDRYSLCPRILSQADVTQYAGLSRSMMWKLVSEGTFPPPIRLTERRIGWERTEVDAWLDARAGERPIRPGRPAA
jgi:prophage regulatory protein